MGDKPESPVIAAPAKDQAALINRLHETPRRLELNDHPDPAADKTGAKTGALTKEPYSPDVSGVAFGALKSQLQIDLIGAEKWDPKTDEQRWWTQATSAAYANRNDLPKGIGIKAKASIGTPDPVNTEVGTQLNDTGDKKALYFGGSINVTETWDAKAKAMPAFDQKGRPIKDSPTGSEKYFDSVYKDGKVFNIDGKTVLETHDNPKTGLRTFLIPNPGNLAGGMDTTKYAQSMVDQALKQAGKSGPVEFPMYDKEVKQKLDGLLQLAAKPFIGPDGKSQQLSIGQAEMDGLFQANEKGQRSFERQGIGMSRAFIADNDPPPLARMDRPFIVAQVSPKGRVFMSAAINPEDFKRPTIEGIDKK